jgi:tight adherence protein C
VLYTLTIVVLASVSLFLFASVLLRAPSALEQRLNDLEHGTAGTSSPTLASRLLSADNRGKLVRRLGQGGWYKVTPSSFVAWRLGAAIVLALPAAGLMVFSHSLDMQDLAIGGVMIVCGYMAPNVLLDRAIAKRKKQIQRALPDMLDMISTTVEAGTALGAALKIGADAVPGVLAEEMRSALSDIRLGRPRAEALAAMAMRVEQPDLTMLVTAINQVDRIGGNIGHVLDELAEDARDSRMMRAEEIATALPVKLIFPLGLFMLPALMVVIFGAVAGLIQSR